MAEISMGRRFFPDWIFLSLAAVCDASRKASKSAEGFSAS
jgi:hypothetical protein